MSTFGIVNATDILVYANGTAISHSTSGSLELNMETRDATTKDSGGWNDFLEAAKNGTLSVDAMHAFDSAYGFAELFDLWTGRTELTVKFSTDVSGDFLIKARALITSLPMEAPTEDNATFSVTFQLTGPITKVTIT